MARPLIMGIVNVTPDSFSDGGRFLDERAAVSHAQRLVEDGADVVDIGAESTRPGAGVVDEAEEWRRLEPVLKGLRDLPIPISVDTTKSGVARRALELGAAWINDVSGLEDPEMSAVCARSGCTLVLMHRRGTPTTMQDDTRYRDLIGEVETYLMSRVDRAIEAGVDRSSIIIDAGVGFGKVSSDNVSLIAATPRLKAHGLRVLVGASRKRFIGDLTGVEDPAERLFGSLGAALGAAACGADVLRVHDVRATVQAISVFSPILEAAR
jgi:dihydropteroate synthase